MGPESFDFKDMIEEQLSRRMVPLDRRGDRKSAEFAKSRKIKRL
jgi:hypothetical protein